MSSQIEAGGYFELSLPDHGAYFRATFETQSARAATAAVLRASPFKKIYLPRYICDTIIVAAERAGLSTGFYALDAQWLPLDLPSDLPANACCLYVNYFGLCQAQVEQIASRIPPAQLLIDNSQALYAPHTGCFASIYSPRKFAGMPDGGWVCCDATMTLALEAASETASLDRCASLLLRAAAQTQAGYQQFNRARQSLNEEAPTRMSAVTRRILRSIDWEGVKNARLQNFQAMDALLGPHNQLDWTLKEHDVPLCYPLLTPLADVHDIKRRLAMESIFIPTYWPDAQARAGAGSQEEKLIRQTLFIPIDQRLSPSEVQRIAHRIRSFLV